MLIIIISRPGLCRKTQLGWSLEKSRTPINKEQSLFDTPLGSSWQVRDINKARKLRDMIDKNKQWSLNYHSLVNLVPKVS